MDKLTAMQKLKLDVIKRYEDPDIKDIYTITTTLAIVIKMIDASLEPEAEQLVDFFERGCFHPKPIINTQIEGQKLYNQIYGDGK